MYLGNIRLEHIKCFETLELDFTQKSNKRPRLMTVILGDNGVGKTTLLQAIAYVLGGKDLVDKGGLLYGEGTIKLYANFAKWIQIGYRKGKFQATIHLNKLSPKDGQQSAEKILYQIYESLLDGHADPLTTLEIEKLINFTAQKVTIHNLHLIGTICFRLVGNVMGKSIRATTFPLKMMMKKTPCYSILVKMSQTNIFNLTKPGLFLYPNEEFKHAIY